MSALGITQKGLEVFAASEISDFLDVKIVRKENGKVFFDCDDLQKLAKFTYATRLCSKVVRVVHEFVVSDMPDVALIDKMKPFLDKTVLVVCERVGDQGFTSYDVEQLWHSELTKLGFKVDRKVPQTIIYLNIDGDKGVLGVDLSGVDLSRRDYRVFLGTDALKGTIAAGLLMFAGFEKKHSLCDPFCRHGVIPIEAALSATNVSPQKFVKEKLAFTRLPDLKVELKDKETEFSGTIIAMDESFKHVSAARKNAKIAGVVKAIEFSRTDLKWLDAKFGKNFLDRIVSLPTQQGRTIDEKKLDKIFHEFFYHAEFIMKKTGKIALCMKRGSEVVKRNAEKFKFTLESSLEVWQGEEKLDFLLFKKQ